jgi:hypothetical protein
MSKGGKTMKNYIVLLFGVVFFLALIAGCGDGSGGVGQGSDSDSDGDDDNDNDDDSDDDDNNDDDDDNDDDDSDTEDDVCSEWDIDISLVPVRIMILQDVSMSMEDDNKWTQAKAALTFMVNTFNDVIEFGFDRFADPGNDRCDVSLPVICDCLPNNAQNIVNYINNISPSNATPLYLGMQNFVDANYAPIFSSPDVASYMVVISDGADTCGLDGQFSQNGGATAQQLADITSQVLNQNQIMTFVIGFGAGADPAQLNAIAAAGGTGLNQYIDAQNEQELQDALTNIGASVASCVYEIEPQDETEVNMDEVNFFFDGELVGYDEDCALGVGWTWVDEEKTAVEFCDEACQQLKDGEVSNISAEFGCPTEPAVE